MGTYLDVAARGGEKVLEETNRQRAQQSPPSGGCAPVLCAVLGASWAATLLTQVHR